MPGDGIGTEVTSACLALLERLLADEYDFKLVYETLDAGADCYRRTGEALPGRSLERAAAADAILFGAMGLPEVRYPDGREIAPQLDLREEFQLFAGVRPVRIFPGLPCPLADPRALETDVVLVRESTEGLFAGRNSGVVEDDRVARDTMAITRPASERLFDFAFELARQRKTQGRPGRVTCVDKANVLQSFAYFRRIFDERAERYPDIEADHRYVDAMAFDLVRRPWDYDVLVTENMFGDILSDLGAGLMGGMGMAPSADIGTERAVFQPCHGSAPDIAGSGKANPTAMFLSAAMMLEWLGARHDIAVCSAAGQRLRAAVERAYAGGGLRLVELGGEDVTVRMTDAVLSCLDGAGA